MHSPTSADGGQALLYGASGYTGELIARMAAAQSLRLVLAGRDQAKVAQLAAQLGCAHRVFALDDPATVRRGIDGMSVVLHCAGPFIHTALPMAEACIAQHVHYLDITGEIDVFEALAARGEAAARAGVMLLPGSGFDVVPSDCLAAHLKRRLPSALHLRLAIRGDGRLSRGTANTMIEHQGSGGRIRRDGVITQVPAGWRTRNVDFGDGRRTAITIPWGNVATAWYSTGIPNIEVYSAVPARLRRALRLTRHLGWLTRTAWFKARARARIRARPPGPDAKQLQHGSSWVWGEVEDAAGRRARAVVHGPDGYQLTALAALLILRRVLGGAFRPGFQTPSLAYGADLVLEIPGVTRSDAPSERLL